jgi:hypothetical protein
VRVQVPPAVKKRWKNMNASTEGGIGIGGLLAVVLIVLKLLDKIDMNWFFVITSFIWIPVIMTIFISLIVFVVVAIAVFIEKIL